MDKSFSFFSVDRKTRVYDGIGVLVALFRVCVLNVIVPGVSLKPIGLLFNKVPTLMILSRGVDRFLELKSSKKKL